MLCDRCKKRPASVKKIQVYNLQKKEINLCSQCAKETGVFGQEPSLKLFNTVFSQSDAYDKQCLKCGFTLKTINQRGRLGCSSCYNVFRQELAPLLRKIHGNCNHSGCRPYMDEEDVIMAIKKEMQKAIEVEDFEKAAELRDRIKSLEEGE